MTPEQLAKSGSEHGVQRALFAWIRWAEKYGFEAAWDDESYAGNHSLPPQPVPELRWCHAIPNGGLRDKITAGKMKQEGALSGVLDIFLPLPVRMPDRYYCRAPNADQPQPTIIATAYCGLYIEMKRDQSYKAGTRKAAIIDRVAGSTSDAQEEFIKYARSIGYAVSVCYDWRSAAKDIQHYVEYHRQCANGLLTL